MSSTKWCPRCYPRDWEKFCWILWPPIKVHSCQEGWFQITYSLLMSWPTFLWTKREGNLGYAAIKLDMSKPYDRVEWCFLEKMMQRMGFQEWLALIMECVTTVRYQVKVNGDLSASFTPQRGLRLGIPYPPIYSCYVQKLFSFVEERGRGWVVSRSENLPQCT
jgi:hypothetical protein